MKNLKKNILIFVVLFSLMMPTVAKAQIYIGTEDEELNSDRLGTDVWFEGGVPYEGGDLDQFTPLGDGLLLLTCLGGAYLIAKRRKDSQR